MWLGESFAEARQLGTTSHLSVVEKHAAHLCKELPLLSAQLFGGKALVLASTMKEGQAKKKIKFHL